MTKRQRNTVYKTMLEYLLDEYDYKEDGILGKGLCHYLSVAWINHSNRRLTSELIEDYPELIRHKPKSLCKKGYWFNPFSKEGTDKRIEVLLCSIAETSC